MLKLGLVSLTLAILAACGVYGLKNRVQLLERELVAVAQRIDEEKIQIRRLKAEWATLAHPERLARLAEQHLGLKPAEPRQIVAIAQIPLRERDGVPAPALVSALEPSPAAARARSLQQ
jgi:cell division protein FtsL